MAKTIDFRIPGDDPGLTRMKSMLEGIKTLTGDKSLVIVEVRVLSVTTEREDIAAILTYMQRATPGNGNSTKKRGYHTKAKETESAEPAPGA